jgi:broad specificity phosphatase PhoE
VAKPVILMRHLATAVTLSDRYVGDSDDCIVPEQSMTIPVEPLPQPILVFSSPARRCRETIAWIQGVFSPSAFVREPIYLDSLRERDLGFLGGMPKSEGRVRYPYLFRGDNFLPDATPPGGETFSEFSERVRVSVERIRQELLQSHAACALVCTHKQFMKMAVCQALAADPDVFWSQVDFTCGATCTI